MYAKPVNENLRDILCVFKEQPAMLAGRFNLIGGKIETNETPEAAALRELKEESGLDAAGKPVIMGETYGNWGVAYCIRIPVLKAEVNAGDGETEFFTWLKWDEVKNTEMILPSLKVIVPLMYCGVTGWRLEDEGSDFGFQPHKMGITVRPENL